MSSSEEEPMEIINVRVQQKPGGIFLTSDDAPGLFLWGKDPESVFADLVPAIRSLYRHNRRLEVEVRPLSLPERAITGEIVPHRLGVFQAQRQAKSA